MEQLNKMPAVAPVELNAAHTSSRVEAPSSSPEEKSRSDEAFEAPNRDSPFYVKGWRLHTLSLRLASLLCPEFQLTIIAL